VGTSSLTSEENEGVLRPEFGASAPGIQREALLPSFPSVRFAAVTRFQARNQDAKRSGDKPDRSASNGGAQITSRAVFQNPTLAS
jgi:hypothetical protein